MKKVMIAIFTVAVILVLVGISYAYFTGRVMGDKKELIVTSKNIRIVFTDEKEISNSEITPGWSESKKFSVKNESNDVFYYNIVFENLVNTFVTEGFLQYKITSTDGGYSMSGYLDIPKSSTPTDVILASNIELPIDVTHNYVVEFVYHNSETVNQNEDQGKIFEGNLYITEGEKVSKTLADKLKSNYNPKPGRTDFSVIDDGEAALYTDTDDQGTTYYFSGDGTDMRNWVSFAGKLWRVIRINGNGSVRMLYAGDGMDATDIGTSSFNRTYNDPMYVGWRYGTSGSLASNRTNENKSTIYGVVENWYNGLNNLDKTYLDNDAIYCNDRNIGSGLYSTSSTFYYAGYQRFVNTKNAPVFKCTNLSDRFTGANSIPVGLMTADEVVAAGGLYGTNSSKAYYYLAKGGSSSITGNNYWWTMSPAHTNIASLFGVSGIGSLGDLNYTNVSITYVVRPAVSLKSEVEVTGGDGSANNPYTVSYTPTLGDTIKAAYPSSGERSSFDSVYDTTALHTATDYNESGSFSGTSYYFTGNPNNWVSYAGKMWRVIRINGNGSVRLLYAGTGGEDGYIGSTQRYNTSYKHPGYVGWKYSIGDSLDAIRENANKSNAYETVENWYNGLGSTDKNYIDGNAIYCNDRNIGSGSFSTSSDFYYASYTRLHTNKTPTFECSNILDRFYNFGLMTADEVLYAGGVYGNDNSGAYYYLNVSGGSSTGSDYWWTMSPCYWNTSGYNAEVFLVYGSSYPGYLSNNRVNSSYVVRPVVSLKAEVIVTGGSGTGTDPYTVVMP